MVSISLERPVETERRLREVLRDAHVRHLPGAWRFSRSTDPANHLRAEAIATIRDDDGWCVLQPAIDKSSELFGITLTEFTPRVDNSGYLGWLASLIKERVGSGVFVVCGDNPARGGIFDYLGYPLAVAHDVHALLAALRTPVGAEPLSLDLRVFEVVEVCATSEISPATAFQFRERDGVVEATYSGGSVVSGFLIGRRDGSRVTAAYAQLGIDQRTKTGASALVLEPDGGGLRLTEEFIWSDGTTGRNVLRSAR